MTAPGPTRARRTTPPARANGRVAIALGVLTVGMLGAAFAAVPFYTWFCKTTGYSGTPAVASIAPDRVIDRKFEVRFDANVHPGLPWAFQPETKSITLKAGQVATVLYRIENLSDQETRGTAVFNVTPDLAGGYFNKLACFCFTEQVLKPHETIEAPVTFFVDPDADGDKNLKGLATITLSYTFYAAEKPAARATTAALAGSARSTQN
jgi:cytochrome c oxidase assembly protein subunit 11